MKLSPDTFLIRLLISILGLFLLGTGWCQAQETISVNVTPEERAVLEAFRARKNVKKEPTPIALEKVVTARTTGIASRKNMDTAALSKKAPGEIVTQKEDSRKNTPFFAATRYKFLETIEPGKAGIATELLSQPQVIVDRKSPKDGGAVFEAFRLRKDWDPVKLFQYDSVENKWVETPTSGTASDGAELGWTRDNILSADSWTANGVAYFPMLVHSSDVRQFVIVPGVEFHRDTSTDGTPNEINSLIGRLGLDFNVLTNVSIPGLARGYTIRASGGYQTDFDFASGQWLFDIQAEPINEAQGVGVFSPESNSAGADNLDAAIAKGDRWKQVLEIPGMPRKITIAPIIGFASIQEIAGKRSLAALQDMTYATLGLRASVDFELEFLKRWAPTSSFAKTKVGSEYKVWTVITDGGGQSFDYFDAHITVPFFGSGDKVSVKAFYSVGDLPATLERVDTIGVALTAKF